MKHFDYVISLTSLGFRIGKLRCLVQLAGFNEPYWWTTSKGGYKTIHLIGIWYERNCGPVFGLVVLPVLFRVGFGTKKPDVADNDE